MFGAGFQSVMKGLGMMIAAIFLFVIVHQREVRLEEESVLVRTDPIAAAEVAFAEGAPFFYHWQHEQGIRDENGELDRVLVWPVMSEQDISPIILEHYTERRTLLAMEHKVIALDSARIERKRAMQFGGQFNKHLAKLLVQQPLES